MNGRLGTLDPTLLLNGGYAIELTATDFNGQIVTIVIDVSVEGQMKIWPIRRAASPPARSRSR